MPSAATTSEANLGKFEKRLEDNKKDVNEFSFTLDDTENLEQLGPVIKKITEAGKQEAFLEGLDNMIRKKDGEIERMCNAHYQVKTRKKFTFGQSS
jgi:hypothetical protein